MVKIDKCLTLDLMMYPVDIITIDLISIISNRICKIQYGEQLILLVAGDQHLHRKLTCYSQINPQALRISF